MIFGLILAEIVVIRKRMTFSAVFSKLMKFTAYESLEVDAIYI